MFPTVNYYYYYYLLLQLVAVREESASIKTLQNTIQALEKDKANLQDRLKRLEKDVKERPDDINQTSGTVTCGTPMNHS